MEFKVGDKVKIKSWEQVVDHYGIPKNVWKTFVDIYTITKDQGNSVYVKDIYSSILKEALIKVEEPTTAYTFKHKVGDIVQIKSLDWYNTNKKYDKDVPAPFRYINSFTEGMAIYCGKQYIVKLKNSYNYTLEDLDNKKINDWSWQDYMFEDSIIENATVDKYSIGSTFTTNGNTYIVEEKPGGGCIGCDLRDIYEECNSDRPKGFECLRSLRSDDKYVIAKKITPNDSKSEETSMDKYPIGSILEYENKEYVVTLDPTGYNCLDCDIVKESGCPSHTSSNFRCCAVNRLDKTNVILKLIDNTNTSKNKYPINSIFTDDGNTFRIKEYTGNHSDHSVLKCKECDGHTICPSYKKDPEKFSCQSDYREDKTSVILELIDNISEIKTKDVLNFSNWYSKGLIIPKYGLQQELHKMLSNYDITELNFNVLSLSEMEKVPSAIVNSEIKLDSITIEYGVL